MGNATQRRTAVFGFGGNKDVERGILNGTVRATIRTRREVEPGDSVRAHTLGLDLTIDSVIPGKVGDLLVKWHKRLGFKDTETAFREWKTIHPHAPMNRVVYLYTFHHAALSVAANSRVLCGGEGEHGPGL